MISADDKFTFGRFVLISLDEIKLSSESFGNLSDMNLDNLDSLPTSSETEIIDKKENIVGAISLDMIGNNTDNGNSNQNHGMVRSIWLLDFIDEINQKYNEYFNIGIERFNNALGAEQSAFLDYGYAAGLFIQ